MIRLYLITCVLFCLTTTSYGQTKAELMGYGNVSDTTKWINRKGLILRKEVYEAFDTMQKAAAAEGVNLLIVYAYRSADIQKKIWEAKWIDPSRSKMSERERTLDILKYSSMPGTSRHHWGTDFDLCSVEPKYFESGVGLKIYQWLVKNASKYGFFQPYTDGRSKGYNTEKWHWSYSPLSGPFLDLYLKTIRNEDLTGFSGSSITKSVGMIENWVAL